MILSCCSPCREAPEIYGLTADQVADLQQHRRELLASYKGDIRMRMSRQMAQWTDKTYDRVVTKTPVPSGGEMASRLAYYSRHPVFGFLFLLVFLAVSYLGSWSSPAGQPASWNPISPNR